MPEPRLLPASAAQLAASPGPPVSAAMACSVPSIIPSAGNSANTETKPSRREREVCVMTASPSPFLKRRGDPLTDARERQGRGANAGMGLPARQCYRAGGGAGMKFIPLILAGLRRNRMRSILTLLSGMVAFLLFGVLQGADTFFGQFVSSQHLDVLVIS